MKKIKFSIIIIIATGFIFSCKSTAEEIIDLLPTDQEIFVTNISKSWNVSNNGSITQDGVDITGQFSNFVLTFGNKTYTSTGGLNFWTDTTSGTWDFVDATSAAQITLSGIPMEVTATGTQLILSFSLSNAAVGGRISSVTGSFIITVSQ